VETRPNGEVSLSEQEVAGGGFFCPSKAKLDITTTPLSATYIAGPPEKTALCKFDRSPCAPTVMEEELKESPLVTSVHETSIGKAKLLASPEVQCDVLFSSTSVGALGAPQIVEGHFTYTNCGCPVKEVAGTTASIEVLKEGHETAKVTGEAEINVNCFGISCTYNGEGLKGTAKGPLLSVETRPNGEVSLSEQEVAGGGFFCPSKAKLDITTTPLSATYIAR
jgi:hypothetical protein